MRADGKSARKRNSRGGFTLVEVILAITILGLIMGLVAGSYYSAAMATRRTEERLELISMGRIALDCMIKEINGALVDEADATKYPFVGENNGSGTNSRDTLAFYTSTFDPAPLGAGSNLSEIGYYLEKTPKLKTYFLQHRMDPFPDYEPEEGGVVTDLAEQVIGLGFSYQDDNETWSNRWDSTIDGKLPRLVQINIILQSPTGQWVQLQGMAAPRRWKAPQI